MGALPPVTAPRLTPCPPNLWPRAIVAIASNVTALASLGPRPWAMWWPGRRGKRRGCRRCLLGSRRGFPGHAAPGGCLRCDDATLEALVRWMAFEALETGANALTEG